MQLRVLQELTFALVLLIAVGYCASEEQQGQLQKCNSLCAVCQSLQQAQALKVCSNNVLDRCSCANYAIDKSVPKHCSQSEESARHFCKLGHTTDSEGCPTEQCAIGKDCDPQWASKCPSSLWCPNGYRTDAKGCPICQCVCHNSTLAGTSCAAECAKLGASGARLVNSETDPHLCPQCVCTSSEARTGGSVCDRTCTNNCGPYQRVNASLDASGCVTDCSCRCPPRSAQQCPSDCRVTWTKDSFGCEICRCAQSAESHWCPPPPNCAASLCGPHGFRVTSHCRRDCQCACPTAKCPTNCARGLAWATDAYGCATCRCKLASEAKEEEEEKEGVNRNKMVKVVKVEDTCPEIRCASCGQHGYKLDRNGCRTCQCNCPSARLQCPGSTCASWSTDAFGCAVCSICHAKKPACVKRETADFEQLCPKNCAQFYIKEDSSGCLTCDCCPAEPRCLIGCGKYPRKRDSNGCVTGCDCDCPRIDINACMRSCKREAKIVTDQFGCKVCQCQDVTRCPQKQNCSNDCGDYGYEADEQGCRASCNCNCPKRECSCIFGSKVDRYGCKTCQCRTISDFKFFE